MLGQHCWESSTTGTGCTVSSPDGRSERLFVKDESRMSFHPKGFLIIPKLSLPHSRFRASGHSWLHCSVSCLRARSSLCHSSGPFLTSVCNIVRLMRHIFYSCALLPPIDINLLLHHCYSCTTGSLLSEYMS